jgi:DNA-binding GntR family transcriptional regulator
MFEDSRAGWLTTNEAPGEPQDLAQKAFDGIRRMLFLEEIAPGEKLRYRDLAKRLGMSPTPVVQALKWLAYQGLISHEANRGFSMAPTDPGEIAELYRLREALELSLLPRTIELLDDTGIKRLRIALDEHLAVSKNNYLKQRLLKDIELHLTLASLSGGKMSRRMLCELFDLLYLKYRAGTLFPRPKEDVGVDHQEIFDAVVARDLKRAQEAMSRHLGNVREHVLGGLRRNMEEKETLDLQFLGSGTTHPATRKAP